MRLAGDGWNSCDASKSSFGYAIDSRWRKRSEFINVRNEILAFPLSQVGEGVGLQAHQEMRLFNGNRIAVRLAYEWHVDSGSLVSLLRQ